MTCQQCGEPIAAGDAFCENCGAALAATLSKPVTSSSETPARICTACGGEAADRPSVGNCHVQRIRVEGRTMARID